MLVGDTASVHHGMDLAVGAGGIAYMLILALAGGRALTFECPDQADRLVRVLGYGSVVALQHGGDASVVGIPEAAHEGRVRVGVECGCSSRQVAGRRRRGSLALSRRGVELQVPRGGKLAETLNSVGEDAVGDPGESRGDNCTVDGQGLDVSEVVLLSFI